MRETDADLLQLQRLLDESINRASRFLRSSFEMPEHSMSARQLAVHLQGSLTVALATTTARSEPRVAPINSLFVRGSFHVPTVAEATRARHLAKRPAVSLTYLEGIELAVIVHGNAALIDESDPDFPELDELQVQSGRESPREWSGRAVYLRIHPTSIYTYARHPDRYSAAAGD